MNTYQPTAEPPATPPSAPRTPRARAFTLVEMIVVTGIIAILAALIFPITKSVKKARDLRRARTELMLVSTAIQGYKDKLGHLPPDNPSNPGTNVLYYELCGTASKDNGTTYQSLDGTATVPATTVSSVFNVKGFINCTTRSGDEGQPAQKFLPMLVAGQYADLPFGTANYRLLGCSLDGPYAFVADPTSPRKFNPWWYNASNPTNNPNSYDLWVDIRIGSDVYRVGNWSSTAQKL